MNAKNKMGAMLLAMAGLPLAASGATLLAHTDDAEFNSNSSGYVNGGPGFEGGGATFIGRQYYAENVNHYVVPFQLPNLGAGTFSDVSVSMSAATPDQNTITVNLRAVVGAREESTTMQSDVSEASPGAPHTGTGLLVMAGFFTTTTNAGDRVTTALNGGVETILNGWLNSAYDNGSSGGAFVFLRLSPDVDYLTRQQFEDLARASAHIQEPIPSLTVRILTESIAPLIANLEATAP